MSDQPRQIEEAREAIAELLGRLEPAPSAEWINERTDHVMLQFDERFPAEPRTKPPG